MRLFLYYALHTFKNQLKKLFKTWVAVYIVICLVIGVVIGLGIVAIGNMAESRTPTAEDSLITDQTDQFDQIDIDEDSNPPDLTDENSGENSSINIFELVVFGIVMVLLLISILTGEKSGAKIFTLSDANLLFASPLKPQSVLLFKMMTQIGALILSGVYILFQLPNLIHNVGLDGLTAAATVLAWVFTLVYSQLISILLYMVSAKSDKVHKLLTPVVYGIIAVIGLGFYTWWKGSELDLVSALNAFFNAKATRYIPVVGWIKGVIMYTYEQNYLGAILSCAALIAAAILVIVAAWRIKVDFYEDALARSTETAELLRQVSEGRTKMSRTGKKPRSEKINRDGFHYGSGANVYFYKAMYNRFRFATFKIFTKTSITYLCIAIVTSLFLKFIVKYPVFDIAGCAFVLVAFYRSLGNPIQTDLTQDSFVTIPESPFAKVFWSMLGGSANCFLDILPAIIITAVFLGGNIGHVIGWLLLAVSIDIYSSSTAMFIDLSLPMNVGKTIKTVLQVMFIYFGILPVVAIIAIGWVMDLLPIFVLIAAAVCISIGMIFVASAQNFISRGRK